MKHNADSQTVFSNRVTQGAANSQATGTHLLQGMPPLCISDNGKVRVGGQGPSYVADARKVRVGGQGPIFR